jgi:RNA polymerase sigma-70 factor (ECF subfamily)
MGIALRYSKNREEALEILNDGFLKAFTKINQYNASYPFKAWLRKILINASIDYHRKYHKLTEVEKLQAQSSTNTYTYNLALDNLAYEDLIKVIQRLSPAYRLVFNLAVIEGMTHKEIAKKLGISEGTSKSNLSKAKGKIQSLLSNSHEIYFRPK